MDSTCSLIEKGPGLIETPNIFRFGKNLDQALPIGNESSWATIYDGGRLKQKKRKMEKEEEKKSETETVGAYLFVYALLR